MDHLPLPHNPIVEKLYIPFVAVEPYDGGSFATYPSRHGWTVEGPPLGLSIKRDHRCTPSLEVGVMLQTWLFFGLMFAVTGQQPEMNLFKKGDDRFGKSAELSTACLGVIVGQWSEQFIAQEWTMYEPKLAAWKDRAYGCLLMARDVVLRVKSTPTYKELDVVCMSIAVLGEYLQQALKDIFIKRALPAPVAQSWRVRGLFDCADPLLDILRLRGWCSSKIAGLDCANAMSIGKLWYLTNIKPPRAELNHELCSSSGCRFMLVHEDEYEIKHQEQGCECVARSPSLQSLASVLAAGALPLIGRGQIESEAFDNRELQVEPRLPDTAFVVISHVWSDGHGNPAANSLPDCFLKGLSKLVDALPNDNPTVQMPFWIDTLCVPLKPPEPRKQAIARLREPYEFAKHVLVLDAYLWSLNSRFMSPIEIVARVESCGWVQRLWIFQEGRLGRRVWYQFRDTTIELFDIIDNVWRNDLYRIPSLPSHSVDLDFIGAYTASNIHQDRWFHHRMIQIPFVRHALSSRATSKAEDEAICLATIMNLSLEHILDVPNDKRMEAFWSLVPEIPTGLAFSKATRKLCQDGYRWAPATLMGDLEDRAWGGPQGLFVELNAKPSDSGLLANLFSFLIRPFGGDSTAICSGSRRSLFAECNQHTSRHTSLHFSDEMGNWYYCILGDNWHSSPASMDATTEEVPILLAYPESHERVTPPRKSELDPEWFEDGLLVTYTPLPDILGSQPVSARVHRHVIVKKPGIAHTQFWNLLLACAEKTFDYFSETKHDYDIDDRCLEEYVMREVESYVRDAPRFLEIAKQIQEYYSCDSSDEWVIKECVLKVKYLVCRWPWCAVEKMAEKVLWCID